MEKAIKTSQSEWFRDWFDENYELVYNHRTDAEAERFVSHWPLDWSKLAGSRALDVGCGNGRFCRALIRRGIKTVGIDLSREQLKLAVSRNSRTDRIDLVRADMRQLPLKQNFGLIVSLFTSFGYFDDDEAHRQVINDLGNLLLPMGTIVIDLPCRENAISEVEKNPLTVKEINGVQIIESRTLTKGNSRFEKTITLSSKDNVSHYLESARLFGAEELIEMTTAANLTQIEPFWGDYSGGGMSQDKSRMVYFGRRNG